MFELRTPSCTHGNGDCDRSVRFFRSSETQYTFDLEGGVGGGHATGWVAVGFSQTQDMVHVVVRKRKVYIREGKR